METQDKLLSRLKPLVNEPNLWKAFTEYLDYLEAQNYDALINNKDTVELYRAQGKQDTVRKMKKLREYVNG